MPSRNFNRYAGRIYNGPVTKFIPKDISKLLLPLDSHGRDPRALNFVRILRYLRAYKSNCEEIDIINIPDFMKNSIILH